MLRLSFAVQNSGQRIWYGSTLDKLVVNLTNYELRVDGKLIDTHPKELELIYHLASNATEYSLRPAS